MTTSLVKFIITCAPRTGSTMLRMILNSHPDITCYGEVITKNSIPNLGKKYQEKLKKSSQELANIRDEDPVVFLYQYVWNSDNTNVVGLKLKYRQLEDQFPEILTKIIEDTTISIIHLTRKNLVKRYISNRLASTGKTPTVINERSVKTEQVKLKVDPDDLLQNIKTVSESESQFKKYFTNHNFIEVEYEDLVLSPDRTLKDLQDFLKVNHKVLDFKTQKVNSDNLKDIVENYSELKDALKNTPYEIYLD